MNTYKVFVIDQDNSKWYFDVMANSKGEASKTTDRRITAMIGAGCEPPSSWQVVELSGGPEEHSDND